MYYIYILYSVASNVYYVGYTRNYNLRLIQHNEQDKFNTYTSKHRPWKLKAVFEIGSEEKIAIQIERYIKKQKSRKLIELLSDVNFIPNNKLSKLIRVFHECD